MTSTTLDIEDDEFLEMMLKLGTTHAQVRRKAEQLVQYVETLETRLLVASVVALQNIDEDHHDARANLDLLARRGDETTRKAARAALEQNPRREP